MSHEQPFDRAGPVRFGRLAAQGAVVFGLDAVADRAPRRSRARWFARRMSERAAAYRPGARCAR